MQTQVLGLSVDSVPCLKAWAESLGGITFPLLSDFYPHGHVAQQYGVLLPDGRSARALFLIDKQGIIRYVDVHEIEQQPDNEVLFKAIAEIEPEAAARYEAEFPEQPEPNADVVMYCTPWCQDCRQARLYLKRHDIRFVEVDITQDRAAARRVSEWAGGTPKTPTFKIKGQVIVEFDQAQVAAALGIENASK